MEPLLQIILHVCAVMLPSAAITGELDYITFCFMTMKQEMLCCLAHKNMTGSIKNPFGCNMQTAVSRRYRCRKNCSWFKRMRLFLSRNERLALVHGQARTKWGYGKTGFYAAWFCTMMVKTLFHDISQQHSRHSCVCKAKHTYSNFILLKYKILTDASSVRGFKRAHLGIKLCPYF